MTSPNTSPTIDQTWIHEQTLFNVSQWDNCMEKSNPDGTKWMYEATQYYEQVCVACNYLDAIIPLAWEKYLVPETTILDMGCGGGWLSAYLSTFESVKQVYALDSSKHFLSNIMPGVVQKMKGNNSKITSIQGLFTPILLPNHSLDIIVSSSALHHANSLEEVLREAHLALKQGGVLIILNETPSPWWRYIARISLAFIKILNKTIFCQYASVSQRISASGFLYDPILGDVSYPLWYWKEAIIQSGFTLVEVQDTMLPTVKNKSGAHLTHFVCQAI